MNIVFDLDGTLANIEHRRHLVTGGRKDWTPFFEACVADTPNTAVVKLFQTLYLSRKHRLEIWSGRSAAVELQTKHWLTDNVFFGMEYWQPRRTTDASLWVPLRMRAEDDTTPDAELKLRWLLDVRSAGWDIDFVVDDRQRVVDMWRANGVTCLQCAKGDY